MSIASGLEALLSPVVTPEHRLVGQPSSEVLLVPGVETSSKAKHTTSVLRSLARSSDRTPQEGRVFQYYHVLRRQRGRKFGGSITITTAFITVIQNYNNNISYGRGQRNCLFSILYYYFLFFWVIDLQFCLGLSPSSQSHGVPWSPPHEGEA